MNITCLLMHTKLYTVRSCRMCWNFLFGYGKLNETNKLDTVQTDKQCHGNTKMETQVGMLEGLSPCRPKLLSDPSFQGRKLSN
jgi:hypothetical protein